jgi:hypothetical protein
MAAYDGSIVYFNIDYDWAFYTLYDNDCYCMNEASAKLICDYFGDDWYPVKLDKQVQFYWQDEKRTIEEYGRVHLLGCKTQEYAVLLFIEGEDANKRNVHINLINPQTGDCLKFCPTLKSDFTEWKIIGVANTTPNTKVLVMGYTNRFLAFYTTLMTWQKGGQDYQCIITDSSVYSGTDGAIRRTYLATMDGAFADALETPKWTQTVYTSNPPFKALGVMVISDAVNVFISVGDVFQALHDTYAITSKINHSNVDYCRYTARNGDAPQIWFRVYGGANDVQ